MTMTCNDKQTDLNGLERIAHERKFSDIIYEMCNSYGLKALAEEIGSDESELSRFKNGSAGLTLPKLERLFKTGELIIIPKKEFKRSISVGLTMAHWLGDAIGWKP